MQGRFLQKEKIIFLQNYLNFFGWEGKILIQLKTSPSIWNYLETKREFNVSITGNGKPVTSFQISSFLDMTLLCSSEGKESLDLFALHIYHILTHEWELVLSIASPYLVLFLPLISSPVHPLYSLCSRWLCLFPQNISKILQVLISYFKLTIW